MNAAAASTANFTAIRGVHGPLRAVRPSRLVTWDMGWVHLRRDRAAPSARAGPTALLNHAAYSYVDHQERTSRAMAADASASFSSAWLPPAATARVTQCPRCSSSRLSATARKALLAALIC